MKKTNKPLIAYCWAGGQIEFGTKVPEGALELGRSGNRKKFREVVEVNARLAYDNKTLLVPGVPEAISNKEAQRALKAVFDFHARLGRCLKEAESADLKD